MHIAYLQQWLRGGPADDRKENMATTFHVSDFEGDYRLYASADITPASLKPVEEREWITDPSLPSGGAYRRTGRNLTDEQGKTLYSVPVHVSTLDGFELRDARVRVRGLKSILPALQLLRPTGDVVATTNNRGVLTLVCDSIEVLPSAAPRHGEVEA